MNSIVVYPATSRQFSVLEALLAEMKVRFSVKKEKAKDDSLMTKEAYFAMLDERIKEADNGKSVIIGSKQELHTFLETL
ncbi:MAG: hypothetical protein LBN27_08300 [Prevotellaceae bacterium]|jgi:adenylate kinase family enzyme|nr:hypothetical protein [Prevotellaceae bacterium]